MKILCGKIGWAWKMFGLSGGKPGKTWFFGFSKEYQPNVKWNEASYDTIWSEVHGAYETYSIVKEQKPIIDKKQNTLHNLNKKE